MLAAACGGGGGLDPLPGGGSQGSAQPQAGQGNVIGSGQVRVGLILPLSAAGPIGMAGAAIRNAAELAMAEFDGPEITLLVKDDRGEPAVAREAATQALAEGAELLLGPLTATCVQQAAAVAKAAGRPMIAFSNDTSVAQPGVYLLSFTPQTDVIRVMSFAASRGKRSIAALLPEGAYGNVIAAEWQQQIARLGLNQGPLQRYAPGRAPEAARALAAQLSGVDALFVTDQTDAMASTADAIATAGSACSCWARAPGISCPCSRSRRCRVDGSRRQRRTASIPSPNATAAASMPARRGSRRSAMMPWRSPRRW